MKKKDRDRYATATGIIHRSYSLAVKDVDNKTNNKSIDTETTSMMDNSSTLPKRKDKRLHQSFLRKKLSMRKN